MLTLAIRFPAGRYHATPWDRHVNEGSVAWPPEPLRLVRALIATWHHKVKHTGRHAESTLRSLIECLSQELPQYALPPASHGHTRHYMPQWKADDTSLVFDVFAAVDRNEPLYVVWPTLALSKEQLALLDDLLAVMGYLGRAESWVHAERVTGSPEVNCAPGDQAVDLSTGEVHGEIVPLLAPRTVEDYETLRGRFLTDRRAQRTLGVTLPGNLLDALSVDTAALRKLGWSQHPAARKVSYLRPLDALKPKRIPRQEVPSSFTTASYLLVDRPLRSGESRNPLPLVEDTLRIGEMLRSAIMSRAKEEFGKHAIPPIFSGHDLPEGSRHQHAFYLPWDANGDGRIDRLLVHVPATMGARERRVIERVDRIRSRGDGEWRVILEGIGSIRVGGGLVARSTVWQSITPYLHPWHVKKGFSIEDQIRRECRERDLPEPTVIERLETIPIGKACRERRPIHFRRFRTKRGLNQPDRRGSFWKLVFPCELEGPLALGFACHFGLGLFAPKI
jgi:CRISPR-associated protein Csb2